MKKIVLFTISILIFFSTSATELHVGDGQTYSTIQEAVDEASKGDVIVIHQGIYREEVRIHTDGITIRANEGDEVIVSGCIPLLDWTDMGNGIYSTTMDWDVTEANSANQVFIDGVMIHNARWPNRTGDLVMDFEEGIIDDADDAVAFSGGSDPGYDKKISVYDDSITNEPAERWVGANIYMNLSNPTHRKDGQGNTGEVLSIDGNKITAAGKGYRSYEQMDNWGIDTDTRYYLYNPTPEAVEATGGVTALLDTTEWWKNGNTLYVKTPDGNPPASDPDGDNLVEAKKNVFVFRPEEDGTFSDVTIRDLKIFAAAITTEENYWNQGGISSAENNLFDNLDFEYIHHTENCAGDWQVQWNGKSGFILSGENNVIKNTTIVYSAASAVSILGKANRLFNCVIHDVNYMVTESGAVNFNTRKTSSTDHEVAYCSIYNTTHAGISMRNIKNADENKPGVARFHHNLLYNCTSRAFDAGYFDEAGENKNWLRIDHNVLYGAPDGIRIGIYVDYGDVHSTKNPREAEYLPARFIIDHNVVYDIGFAIGVNAADDLKIFNNTVLQSDWSASRAIGNGVLLDEHAKNSIVQNNISEIDDAWSINGTVSHNLNPESDDIKNSYFVDAANGNFMITEDAVNAIDAGINIPGYDDVYIKSPDLGAYEFGLPKWSAGAADKSFTLTIISENGSVNYKSGSEFPDGTQIVLKAQGEKGYGLSEWSGDASGNENPLLVSMDSDKTITANFTSVPTYSFTVNADENGTTAIYPQAGSYNQGDDVQITANPTVSEIYEFDKWTGDVSSGSEMDNPLRLIMDGDKSLTANFKRQQLWYEFTDVSYINTFEGKTLNNVEISWRNNGDFSEINFRQSDRLTMNNVGIKDDKIIHEFLVNTIDISSYPKLHLKAMAREEITLIVNIYDHDGNSTNSVHFIEFVGEYESKEYIVDFFDADIDLTKVSKIEWGVGDVAAENETRIIFEALALGTQLEKTGISDKIHVEDSPGILVNSSFSEHVLIKTNNFEHHKYLEIFDLQGRCVYRQETTQNIFYISKNIFTCTGIFFVKVHDRKRNLTKKVFVDL